MNKPRYFYKDTYHHLYNRGTNKMNIFVDDENYFYFIKQMSLYKEKYKIKILAYCLMPNHFHIFASQTTDELSISHFMSALSNSYTKSFNKLFNRSGILFESKFKSKEVEVLDYFKIVVKYIIDNPVAAGLVGSSIEWEYSNARDLLVDRNNSLCELEEVKSLFTNNIEMLEFFNKTKTQNNIDNYFNF